MKKLVLWSLAVALAAVFAGGTAYASANQVNGTSATTMTCTTNCSSSLYLILYSNQSGGTTTWMVTFGLFGTDSSGNPTSISASGTVPASMISGNQQNTLTLALDTNAAGLQVQYCVADQYYNYTCNPYQGGTITATFNTTSNYSNHSVEQNQTTFGNFTVHLNLQSDTSSATAQTNAFGTQFVDGNAQFGTSHSGTVEITNP
ncbi:MAG TPA: hypothetical protein VGM18_05705 [Candidatus Sulfotelmatobacter sp.]|jgi:hypothetical protein